jgi:hypothetical protein
MGQVKLYNTANLYNLVDGEAEAIMAYTFQTCAHAEYTPVKAARQVLTIDVYDMKDPLNAFGLFSSDRLSGQQIAIGTEGVQIQPSGLNFWKGRYVVRTTIIKVDPASKAAQQAFARATAAKIPGASAIPAVVKSLPPGRQPRSEKYVRTNVAGQRALSNAVTAKYPKSGMGAELFIAQYPSPAGAKAALAAYQGYERSGRGLAPVKGLGDQAFQVQDKYAKNVVAAQKGKFVVGAHHCRDAASAQALVRQALAKLK